MSFVKVGMLMLTSICIVHATLTLAKRPVRVFNVLEYGATTDPRVDSTPAFLRAWNAACGWGRSRVLVPRGDFILGPVTFIGPCNGPLTLRIEGVIKAHPGLVSAEMWIGFKYLTRFTINGGGAIDGIADRNWFRQYCGDNTPCHNILPVSIGLDFVTNSRIHHIASINSKNTHINIFGCSNIYITKVRLHAPAQSPNTDGIRIGQSDGIAVTRSIIGTGDDCVSMLGGSRNIRIADVSCGPGHGISVGSLGRYKDEDDVVGVTVQRCTFAGTTNGMRIKTWAASASSSSAWNLLFEDLHMSLVANPIIIDQQYCSNPPCQQPPETPTQVQIRDVMFRNIWGTSTTRAAVNLHCSNTKPCRNLTLENINLSYDGLGGAANSVCYNARGVVYGYQKPRPCI